MIHVKNLLKAKVGGATDAWALLAIAVGGLLTMPALLGGGYLGTAAALLLSCAGGAVLGRGLIPELRLTGFRHKNGLELNSSSVLPADPAGVHVGYVEDRADPLVIPPMEWMRHAMIVGQSGVGKTVLGEWLMFQQIRAGGGMLWIDGKLDPANLEKLWHMAVWCGRGDDVLVINPGDPAMSNTYNPLLEGEPDEIAARCISLVPTSEGNAATDYYRQAATIAITTLVEAIRATGLSLNFSDLRLLLTNAKALDWLKSELEAGGKDDAALHFSLFLEQFRRFDKITKQNVIDMDAMKRTFGGLGSRLAQFGGGTFGQVMNAYDPEVRLKDCVMQGKILYVMLPTMGKNEAATALGKMVIGDFRSAIAAVQSLPEAERPQRPFLGFFDEAGSYVTQAWSRMFEQARSARLVMVPAFQTKANLEVLGEDLRAMVAGNTLTKVFFKPGEPDTAEWMADMIGRELQVQRSVSANDSTSKRGGTFSDHMRGSGMGGSTSGEGSGASESAREGYKVTPDDLAKLGKGECIVVHDGSLVYKVHVPRLTFDCAFVVDAGPFRLNHFAAGEASAGLDMLARGRDFISE